jgi:hypothetical protein
VPRPSNYSKGRQCERCGKLIWDYSASICFACHNERFSPDVVISPWQVIENGVRMRTISSAE